MITVMIMKAVAKKPKRPMSAPPKRRPGRPPKPGGAIPHVEVQRAYRARLKAAGKGVRIVELSAAAIPVGPAYSQATGASSAEVLTFDPTTEMVCDRKIFEDMRDRLRHALSKLALRDERLEQIEKRNAWLEGELKRQERHHANSLKEIITLKQKLEKRR
jgi:hypothetical protein